MAKEVTQSAEESIETEVKSVEDVNQTIKEFKAKFLQPIHSACFKAKLNVADWGIVVNDVCNKFCVTHTARFDPNHRNGANEYGFVYTVAMHCAYDIARSEHRESITFVDGTIIERGMGSDVSESYTDVDSEIWHALIDNVRSYEEEFTKEDISLIRKQVLIRLFRESRNKKHIEMFVRRLFYHQTVDELAKEFNVRASNVSLICATRLTSRFEEIARKVLREDENGRMELLDEREIAFLGKYLKSL